MLPSPTRASSNAAHSAQAKSFASSARDSQRFDRCDRPLNPLAAAISLRTSLPSPTYVMAAFDRL
jgi:hypothetical protein